MERGQEVGGITVAILATITVAVVVVKAKLVTAELVLVYMSWIT